MNNNALSQLLSHTTVNTNETTWAYNKNKVVVVQNVECKYCKQRVSCCKMYISAELTVRAGLKLERGTAGSISSSSARSDLKQVGSVWLQTVQGHVTTPSTEDGVAGLLLFL